MADTISFGENVRMFGPAAMMHSIFRYLRQHDLHDPELKLLVSREEEFDAQGGWFFDDLSLTALKHLYEIIVKFQEELPGVISDWNESYRPKFYHYFAQFKGRLAERIDEREGRGAEPGTGTV